MSVPSHRTGVALTLLAFQLASLVDIAGLKVSGGHGDEQSYSVLFQPKFQASLWGSESCFRFDGILKLSVGSCSVQCDELCRTEWGHTRLSPNIPYVISFWASLDVNAQLCEARWTETAAQRRWLGKGNGLFFLPVECVSFPENIPLIFKETSVHTSSLWKGYCVSAAFWSGCLHSSLLAPSGAQIPWISIDHRCSCIYYQYILDWSCSSYCCTQMIICRSIRYSRHHRSRENVTFWNEIPTF